MPNPTGHTESIKNSQFKAAWQSGPTCTIRVPIALAKLTLEYARRLDQGIEPRDTRQVSDIQTSIARTEPLDTGVKGENPTNSPIDTVAIEPRDTGIMQAELEKEVQKLRSKLEQEEADRQKAQRELEKERKARQVADKKLEDLQENPEIDFDFDFAGKAGELVSWLRKTVGKALPKQVTVKEVQKILEGGDN